MVAKDPSLAAKAFFNLEMLHKQQNINKFEKSFPPLWLCHQTAKELPSFSKLSQSLKATGKEDPMDLAEN